MKFIDLLNKIANNELEDKIRFKIFTNNFTLLCEYDKSLDSILFVDSLNKDLPTFYIDYETEHYIYNNLIVCETLSIQHLDEMEVF